MLQVVYQGFYPLKQAPITKILLCSSAHLEKQPPPFLGPFLLMEFSPEQTLQKAQMWKYGLNNKNFNIQRMEEYNLLQL